jgi:hypothetical protein
LPKTQFLFPIDPSSSKSSENVGAPHSKNVIVAANTVSLIWSFLVDGADQLYPDTPTLDRHRERLKPQLAPAQYTPGRNQQLRHFDWGETVGALEHPGATGRIAK